MEDTLIRIEQQRKYLQTIIEDSRRVKDEMSLIESLETINIVTATNVETGKLIFTNDKLREAALVQALDDHEQYNTLKDSLVRVERLKVETEAEIERLRGLFKLHLLDRQEAISGSTALDSIAESLDKIAIHGIATKSY